MIRRLSNIQNKTVIVAPLDWGLGHATRCIPIIKELQKNNKCIIATSGRAYELLQQEFPTITTEKIPAYNIAYGKNKLSTFMKLVLQIPKSLIIKNKERAKHIRAINTDTSKVKILIITTNEELEIAKQSVELFEN